MPVSVNIPIRIQLDENTIRHRPTDLEEALRAAAGRAFGNARDLVLDEYGDYLVSSRNRPHFRWSGADLDRVSEAEKTDVQNRVKRILNDLYRAHEIRTRNELVAKILVADDEVSEVFQPDRFNAAQGTYEIPVYDEGGEPVATSIESAADSPTTAQVNSLASAYTLEEVYQLVIQYFPTPWPRGHRMYGVYVLWQGAEPRLFWVSGQSTEGLSTGQPFFVSRAMVRARESNGQWEATGSGMDPVAVTLGQTYDFINLIRPRMSEQGTPYEAEIKNIANPDDRILFANVFNVLRAKTVRFAVPFESITVVQVTATQTQGDAEVSTPVDKSGWICQTDTFSFVYGANGLPCEPQEGHPEWLWWWLVLFNIRPASLRAYPLVHQIFEGWENSGGRDSINLLFLHVHAVRFFRAYCQLMAIRMLRQSAINMQEFLRDLRSNRAKWIDRLQSLVDGLSGPASRLVQIEDEIRDLQRVVDSILSRVTDSLDIRGRSISQADLNRLSQATQAVRDARSRHQAEVEKHTALLQLVQEMEPLLVLLTLRTNGQELSIQRALVWASHESGDELFGHVVLIINWQIGKNAASKLKLEQDWELASQLKFVQQVALFELQGWLDANPTYRTSVSRFVNPDQIGLLLLGAGVIVLTFAFPPLGIGLGAVMGVAIAADSIQQALNLSNLSDTRLAQLGFRPLVSDAEINAAITKAVIDVIFAAIDVGFAAGSAVGTVRGLAITSRLSSAAARETAGALGNVFEALVAGWRNLGKWPAALTGRVEARVLAELDAAGPAWRAGLTEAQVADQLGEATKAVQLQMVARYEDELLRVQTQFRQALEAGQVGDVEAWLTRAFPEADEFFNRLIRDELQAGSRLYERTIAQLIAGQAPETLARVSYLGHMTAEELKALRQTLGEFGEILSPNRLHGLGIRLNLDYQTLATRLHGVLTRVDSPASVLTRIEDLIEGRSAADAARFLNAMESVANPGPAIRLMTGNVLDVSLVGRFDELFEAASRTSRHGTVVRMVTDVVDVNGQTTRYLFREVRRANGSTFFQRWDGLATGWNVETRIAGSTTPAAAETAIGASERAAAAHRLGRASNLVNQAGRTRARAASIATTFEAIQAHPRGVQILDELADAAIRAGDEVAEGIMVGYARMRGGPTVADLDHISHFLRNGGDPRVLKQILDRPASWVSGRRARNFLEVMSSLESNHIRGVGIVMAERGFNARGAEAVVDMAFWWRHEARSVFGAIDDLAPHADGLSGVIGYLKSDSQNLRLAAVSQLYAGKRLLEEFPNSRLIFEAKLASREIDIRVVTQFTRQVIIDVELKEITGIIFLQKAHAHRQMARDIVRSTLAATGNQNPLKRIRWLIRETELIEAFPTREALIDALKAEFAEAFKLRIVTDALTPAQIAAAQQDLADNFETIVRLF